VKTAPLNTVKLGRTDLKVFPIAFGAWRLGGERGVRDSVDHELLLELMSHSPFGSLMLKARASFVLVRPEDAWFDIVPMHKDFRLALEGRDVAAIFEVLARIEGAPVTSMPMAAAG
jgi:hypothetical protein